ncbi:MAG TPA: tetratricopeptide repeat protein [Vicinamibacterales bacterium]|nr:tetratricopeptide repeat protein [Vicinamibacterales bacterium]
MEDSPRIEDLRRRVLLDPASIAFAALAEEYRRAGRFDDAIATCVTGLKRHPSYLSARVTLGRALMDAGRIDDARAELEVVLRAAPENLAALRSLAEIHRLTDDAAPAVVPEPPAPPPAPPPPTLIDPRLAALESFLAAVQTARGAAARPTA